MATEVSVGLFPQLRVLTNGRGAPVNLGPGESRQMNLVVSEPGQFAMEDLDAENPIARFREQVDLRWTNTDPEFTEYDVSIIAPNGNVVFSAAGLTGNSLSLDTTNFECGFLYQVDLRCYTADGQREARLNFFPRFTVDPAPL